MGAGVTYAGPPLFLPLLRDVALTRGPTAVNPKPRAFLPIIVRDAVHLRH